MKKVRYSVYFILALTVISGADTKIRPGDEKAVAQLRATVEFLASPELQGRFAGSSGAEVAAKYIAVKFEELGLKPPANAPQYYQEVPLTLMKVDIENTTVTLMNGNDMACFTMDKDFFFLPKGGDDLDTSGGVVLCGYGITAGEYSYDDYKNADLKGKMALVFYGEPGENDSGSVFKGVETTKYSLIMTKVNIARARGAIGLLMMQPPKGNYPGKMEARVKFQRQSLDKSIVQLSGRMEAMPVFYLTDESAGKVIGGQVDLRKYQNEIEENSGGEAIELKNVTLRLNINFKDRMQTVSPNVAGYLPGEHPDKREELLIIGAHYDHLGSNDSQIFYGADDNASGVAGLLYLAEAFTQAERKPERSLLFIAFSAEEEGTLGSLYYTLNPLFPLENTVAMINLDGIGRNGAPSMGEMRSAKNFSLWDKYVMVLYSGQSPELAELNQKHHHKTGLEIDLDPNLRFFGSSDQMNFHNCGIPSLFYFTGFHPDYHTPNDTAEKLNYPKMVKILDLVYNVADEILNKKGRLKYDPGAQIPAKKSRMNF